MSARKRAPAAPRRARADGPPPRARATATAAPKVQRWIDLLAALLARRFPVSFEDLARDVPAYRAGTRKESLQRMFERDKDELRSFGIAIETVAFGGDDQVGYRLRGHDFYLPYLALAASDAGGRRRGASGEGRTRSAPLTFEPDELAAVVQAGRRICALGDPLLTEDAESALRKLAADLPVDATAAGEEEHVVPSGDRVEAATFATLGHALLDRKRVGFDYRAMASGEAPPGEPARRTVEPYGLFFLDGHWYLAGRDRDRDALRNFRLSRMSAVSANRAKPQSPDYVVPPAFSLREHARSRQAWELGDHEPMEAVIELRAGTGAAAAAARLGEPVEGQPARRRFRVRRPDAFARWLLSFAGDAVPVEPAPLVEQWRALARETLARHGEAP